MKVSNYSLIFIIYMKAYEVFNISSFFNVREHAKMSVTDKYRYKSWNSHGNLLMEQCRWCSMEEGESNCCSRNYDGYC